MAKGVRRKKASGKSRLMGIVSLFTAVIFMPTTIVLLMGMIPTVVAAVVDRSGKGTKALTVGAMNLAGCTPFLIDLWSKGHTPDIAVTIISDPRVMSVMYAAAGVGYLISWAMSGLVGTMMVQRGAIRIEDIKRRQEKMVERWGVEVTGEVHLDAYGFPIETQDKNDAEEKADEGDDKKTAE